MRRIPVPPLLAASPIFAGAMLALCASTSTAAQESVTLEHFLRQEIGLEPSQLTAARAGEVVVQLLETKNPRDVAVFGIVAVDVPRSAVMRRLRDFPRSLRTPTRAKLGLFGDPPAPRDVAAVAADNEAVEEIRKCRAGRCNFKMPAGDMTGARQAVEGASDPRGALARYVQQRMVEYAADYRARGNAALVVYDDRGGVRASDAFTDLLAASPYVYRYVPLLHDYLRDYPAKRPPGVTDVLVWWQDEMQGLRPVLAITHLTLYDTPQLPNASILSAKQLYANHYFEAAFDLLTVIDRPASNREGVYLLLLRRYRFDNLPSGGLLNIRGRVVGKLREGMRVELTRMRSEHERAASASR